MFGSVNWLSSLLNEGKIKWISLHENVHVCIGFWLVHNIYGSLYIYFNVGLCFAHHTQGFFKHT